MASCEVDPALGLRKLPHDAASGPIVEGIVPLAVLAPYGISELDMADSWNNRIWYMVDRQLTPGGTGTPAAATDRIVVVEPNTNTVFHQPDFLLMSMGRDGVGAIPINSVTYAITCPSTDTPTLLSQMNCAASLTHVQQPALTAVSTPANAYFDDLLSFYGAH